FAGVPNPSGGASAADQGGSFTWEITPEGKLIITEETITGTFTAGNRVGWSVVNTGVPRQVGVLGKDLRVIALATDGLKVEHTQQTSPDGTQSTGTDRICTRERLLRKLEPKRKGGPQAAFRLQGLCLLNPGRGGLRAPGRGFRRPAKGCCAR